MSRKKGLAVVLAAACALSALFAFSGCDVLFDTPDYAEWSKNISDKTILSSVRVEETERESPFSDQGEVAQGSGIIIYETADNYYALTNNHVVYKDYKGATSTHSVEIINCYDGAHPASILYQDANYDLAVIAFTKRNRQTELVDLEVTSLAHSNPSSTQALAAVGSPDGRHNSTTFGKALRYEKISLGDAAVEESNVRFSVLVHDVYTLSGSSGCAIINEQLQLAGIHYACGFDEFGGYVEGYAIPAEKIREFLIAAELATNRELGV